MAEVNSSAKIEVVAKVLHQVFLKAGLPNRVLVTSKKPNTIRINK